MYEWEILCKYFVLDLDVYKNINVAPTNTCFASSLMWQEGDPSRIACQLQASLMGFPQGWADLSWKAPRVSHSLLSWATSAPRAGVLPLPARLRSAGLMLRRWRMAMEDLMPEEKPVRQQLERERREE